jgi:hypothetical protein
MKGEAEMKPILVIVTLSLAGVVALNARKPAVNAQRNETSDNYDMPKPRDVGSAENRELAQLIQRRFGANVRGEMKARAAGAFRFAGTNEFLYIDRTDVGSVAFDRADYGDPYKARSASTQAVLTRRVAAALKGTDLDVVDRRFAEFQNEFAGAAQPAKLSRNFDPRKASKLVAQTMNFERVEQGLPFFGSEFLIGLNPDGSIGRFRKHWPKVDAGIVARGRELQKAVRSGRWQLPAELRGDEFKIIEITAGVGHSSFADPGFRADAVVRVLFRKTASGTQYPISSTGYKYFTMDGKEVRFSRFPELPESTRKHE